MTLAIEEPLMDVVLMRFHGSSLWQTKTCSKSAEVVRIKILDGIELLLVSILLMVKLFYYYLYC